MYRLFFVLLLAVLSGCGGTYSKRVSDVTGSEVYLDRTKSSVTYQGLESVELTRHGLLKVRVNQRLYAPEVNAPVITTKQVARKKPNPVGSVLVTGLTFGLYPLFAPVDFLKETFGHQTNEEIVGNQTQRSDAKPTGRYEWVTEPFTDARLQLKGKALPQPLFFQVDSKGQLEVNLSRELLRAVGNLGSRLDLELVCINCASGTDKPTLSRQAKISFLAPESWPALATYYSGGDLGWLADSGMFGEPSERAKTTGREVRSWDEFSKEVSVRAIALLKSKQELPPELRRERADLQRNKPNAQVTVTRDEFESSSAFALRVQAIRAEEQKKAAAYNERVDRLNQAIKLFQSNAPRQLSSQDLVSVMQSTFKELVGEPAVLGVVYDADLEQFLVRIGTRRRDASSDFQFNLITTERFTPTRARVQKELLTSARPFIRLQLTGSSLVPKSAHLLLNDTAYELRFLEDGLASPKLQTARIEVPSPAAIGEVARFSAETEVTSFSVTSDPESRRLLEELKRLRATLQQRQGDSERLRLVQEIRNLEGELKRIDEGNFTDDIRPVIDNLATVTPRENLHAVVIGITNYSELPNVIFADRSARAFADTIRKRFGVPTNQITMLLNEEATGTRLLARLQSISSRLGPQDKLIVYFSGHGSPTPDGKTTVLIPHDASAESPTLSALDLQGVYKTVQSGRAAHSWIVLDVCFSGRTDSNELLYKDVAPIFLKPKHEVSPIQYNRLTVLAAGGASEFANAKRSVGYRLFSYYVIKELLTTAVISPLNFENVSRQVSQDASRLGPAFLQRPMWLGVETPLLK